MQALGLQNKAVCYLVKMISRMVSHMVSHLTSHMSSGKTAVVSP